jgi:hypothetical protein
MKLQDLKEVLAILTTYGEKDGHFTIGDEALHLAVYGTTLESINPEDAARLNELGWQGPQRRRDGLVWSYYSD